MGAHTRRRNGSRRSAATGPRGHRGNARSARAERTRRTGEYPTRMAAPIPDGPACGSPFRAGRARTPCLRPRHLLNRAYPIILE